jgi:hypothetical protein
MRKIYSVAAFFLLSALTIMLSPAHAAIIDTFDLFQKSSTPECKLDTTAIGCTGTTLTTVGSKLFTEFSNDPSTPTGPLDPTKTLNVLGGWRTTFLKADSLASAGDNVNAHLITGEGFVFQSTSGADGRFSLFYGAPVPFDANFSAAKSIILEFKRLVDFPVPISVKIIMHDKAIKVASSTQTKILFPTVFVTSEILEFPISSFAGISGFDLSHVIFIEIDVDPGTGGGFILTQAGTVGGAPVPALSKWGIAMCLLILAGSGLWLVRRRIIAG